MSPRKGSGGYKEECVPDGKRFQGSKRNWGYSRAHSQWEDKEALRDRSKPRDEEPLQSPRDRDVDVGRAPNWSLDVASGSQRN